MHAVSLWLPLATKRQRNGLLADKPLLRKDRNSGREQPRTSVRRPVEGDIPSQATPQQRPGEPFGPSGHRCARTAVHSSPCAGSGLPPPGGQFGGSGGAVFCWNKCSDFSIELSFCQIDYSRSDFSHSSRTWGETTHSRTLAKAKCQSDKPAAPDGTGKTKPERQDCQVPAAPVVAHC